MHHADGRVVSNFIVQALKGGPIAIHGDGRQTRSFCYVTDTVDGIIALMESDPVLTGPVNLGNPDEITILELAQRVIRKTESRSEIVHKPLPENDPRQRQPHVALARERLGWEPVVPLEMGLDRTIAFFSDRLPHLSANDDISGPAV